MTIRSQAFGFTALETYNLAAFLAQYLADNSLPIPGSGVAKSVLTGTATYDPPSLADGAAAPPTTVTVTGAALGDFALVSFSLDLQGIMLTASVSAANTVTVRLFNKTGGVIDLASGTLTAKVLKF